MWGGSDSFLGLGSFFSSFQGIPGVVNPLGQTARLGFPILVTFLQQQERFTHYFPGGVIPTTLEPCLDETFETWRQIDGHVGLAEREGFEPSVEVLAPTTV